MNKTLLLGRITKDIELKATQSGTEVASFTLAVNRNHKNVEGYYDTDFINCVCYGKTAETVSKFTKKGDRLGVEGRIQTGSYEKDGKKIYTTDIIVENITFIESKKKEVTAEDIISDLIQHEDSKNEDTVSNDIELPF